MEPLIHTVDEGGRDTQEQEIVRGERLDVSRRVRTLVRDCSLIGLFLGQKGPEARLWVRGGEAEVNDTVAEGDGR